MFVQTKQCLKFKKIFTQYKEYSYFSKMFVSSEKHSIFETYSYILFQCVRAFKNNLKLEVIGFKKCNSYSTPFWKWRRTPVLCIIMMHATILLKYSRSSTKS